MADGMNNKLVVRRFIENKIGVGRRRHAAGRGVVRARTDKGMQQKKVNNFLNAGLETGRAPCGDCRSM